MGKSFMMRAVLSEELSTPDAAVYEVFDDQGTLVGFNITATAPAEDDPAPDTQALAEALSALPPETLDALKAALGLT